jgi:YidC/Oxa1 family membrane protein insertase
MNHDVRQVFFVKLVSGMEQRRFLVFFLISMAVWMAWINLAVPVLFPDFNKPVVKQQKTVEDKGLEETAGAEKADPNSGAQDPNIDVSNPAVDGTKKGETDTLKGADGLPAKVVERNLPKHPALSLLLGPADPDQEKEAPPNEHAEEFFLAARLTTEGASIESIELTDKDRYPAFGRRGTRVRVIGSEDARVRSGKKTRFNTFSLQSPQIDKLLGGVSLDRANWEVVPQADSAASLRAATFRFLSPDGQWELIKHFEIKQLTLDELKQDQVGKTLREGYELKLKITIKNLMDERQSLSYSLQGPVGVPLEDAENSYKHRDVRMGFLRDDGNSIDENKKSAAATVKEEKSNKPEVWKRGLKYIGVDVLYFAALVLPGADQVDSVKPMVTNELYAGPKREELIKQIPAMAVMDYGWFDIICRGMVWLLNMFHGLGLSYGIAIICLTVLVRTLLIPISKLQAGSAAKMKELTPILQAKQKEAEVKYGKGSDEYNKVLAESSKESLGHMMSGCLPAFLQLPIFIALYRSIGSYIDLRMEPFLWFENLASPDALYKFPFTVPWLGWTDFNLLPCISAGLMFAHQKLTMPPPTNEEQAQQQKMMSWMMLVMGAMFFRVPSGLCLYFIATNIWSMTERTLFEHWKKKKPVVTDEGSRIAGNSASDVTASKKEKPKEPEKPTALGSLWDRLQKSADSEFHSTRQLESNAANRDDKKKKKRT